MGIAIFPDDGTGPDRLLQNADTALYRAKERGRNNYQFFSEDMNKELMERARLEGALRLALDHGDLEIYYQPVIDFSSGSICSSEALLRWRHPTLGWIEPDRMIRLAEDTGLIIPLGEWILKQACWRLKSLNDKGFKDYGMAVNISGHQLNRAGFLESVCAIIEESGIDPSSLQLELTETVAMGDIEMSSRIFRDLRERGVKIVIDDFGTGYSSLSYLKALPIDALKIDRAFVNDIARSASNRAIVSAIVAMGHSLDLKVVVEGIETNEQLCHLWALDCDEWQGYLFSPAVAFDELEQYLLERRAASAPGVSWTTDLSVHVAKIDDQHKVWCERVNTLYKSIWSGVKISELREFTGFLSDYARLHFSDEEALMKEYNYPEYEEHKQAHRELLNKINDLKIRISTGEVTSDLVSELLHQLQGWFLDHIKKVDKELGMYVGQRNIEGKETSGGAIQ
jgi:hemerythrin-like metal-binding protein